MTDLLKALTIGLVLAAAVPAPEAEAEAAGASRLLQRAQNPTRPETCKPKWPYVVLTCVA